MSDFGDKLKYFRTHNELSQEELAKILNTSKQVISRYERKERTPSLTISQEYSEKLDVPMIYFADNTVNKYEYPFNPETKIGVTSDTSTIRYLGEIAASFDNLAIEEYTFLTIPTKWLHGRPASDFYAMKVKGESMYPLYCNGDTILCLHVSAMDRSGQVGIYLHGEEATLKRINYVEGEDWVELVPVNPEYVPKRIEGVDLEQSRVIGKVVKLIRSFEYEK